MMRSIGYMLEDAVLDASARLSLAFERHPMAALAVSFLVVLPIVGYFECH